MPLFRTKAPATTPTTYKVLDIAAERVREWLDTERLWFRAAVLNCQIDDIERIARDIAIAEAQLRIIEDAIEADHMRSLAHAEASEVLAQPEPTDEELDRMAEDWVNADAARRGPRR